MKVEHYNALMARHKMSRRRMLQGAASVGAVAAATGAMPTATLAASHSNLRAELLAIPGVGMGSPTDADWQKVGELTLGPTKERVAEGWIDLAQADYNPRLQQAIATGTVDFDIVEMGAPFEGDTAGKGLLDEMPDWVKEQIEADDLVDYLKDPVGI